MVTPLGDVMVFKSWTVAGNCLPLNLAGDAWTLNEGASKPNAREVIFRLEENMLGDLNVYAGKMETEKTKRTLRSII